MRSVVEWRVKASAFSKFLPSKDTRWTVLCFGGKSLARQLAKGNQPVSARRRVFEYRQSQIDPSKLSVKQLKKLKVFTRIYTKLVQG